MLKGKSTESGLHGLHMGERASALITSALSPYQQMAPLALF